MTDATWMPDEPVHHETPRPVAVAFWLWVPLIVFQTLLVLWNVIGTAQTDPSGLAVSVTLNLLTLAIVAVSAVLLFRLRRGSRAARGWLLGFAIFWLAIAVYQALAVASHVVIGSPGSSGWWIVVVAILNVVLSGLACVGALIPFLSPTSAYFAKRAPVSEPFIEAGPRPTADIDAPADAEATPDPGSISGPGATSDPGPIPDPPGPGRPD